LNKSGKKLELSQQFLPTSVIYRSNRVSD